LHSEKRSECGEITHRGIGQHRDLPGFARAGRRSAAGRNLLDRHRATGWMEQPFGQRSED
jgi:hypothetical protein